jgi:hypothetical protein
MQKSIFMHGLLACLAITTLRPVWAQQKVPFSFTLAAKANTSAGVYTKNGILVKNLWSGVPYTTGMHTQYWDGTSDDGELLTADSFEVRVLSNNINYTWEGVIGNTSTASSGNTVHHAFQSMYGIAFAGTHAYYTTNYNEQQPPIFTFNTTTPQAKTSILNKGGATAFVATDSNYVYWDATDPNDTASTFVYATRVSDNSEVTGFTSGTAVSVLSSRTYASAIDVNYNANARITGLAVQKKGNYLFVAHQKTNQIHVLNKLTGAVVKIFTTTSPQGLTVDNSGNLWVISNNAVTRYLVGSNGSLTSTAVSISGFNAPLAAAVSTDGKTIVVADGGASQQLKAYNTSTGAQVWVYGTLGGYAGDATVANNKFYFADQDGVRTFINFAGDGSFWVGDPGNARALHFTGTRAYVEQLMFLPHFYSSVADQNNATRVFADFMEFKIDYSKSLGTSNSSWILVKNWGYPVTKAYNDAYFRLRGLTTLSNGRTYAFLRHASNLALVELPATGNIRFTGIELPGLGSEMMADGSLRSASAFVAGKPMVWSIQPLTGFTASGNPVWGASATYATSPAATQNDPVNFGSGNTAYTTSNILVSFDAGLPPGGSSGYHLGGIKAGDNKWLWRTAKVTSTGYTGPYPADGAYDIGNGVKYGGCYVRALDRTVIWGYHGEFWKNSQVNKWTQVYDDGLFVGQFGVAGPEYTNPEAAPMMAGNAFAASVVKDSAGNAYMYQNDESYHSGIHRWKITGLNTLAEQTIPIALPAAGQGLMASYFTGTDLNNFNIKLSHVEAGVELDASNIDAVTNNSVNTNNFSTRWAGYITPPVSGTYTFYTMANKGVRLWMNDTLVIDHWANTTTNEYSTAITLTAGHTYPIRMEYYNNATALAKLSWSSASLAKQLIPAANLVPLALPDTATGKDLMEGLPFKKLLAGDLYGWKRNPANEDSTDTYNKWWCVNTGYKSYSNGKSADVSARYAQSTGAYTITRDLGTSKGVDSWTLDGSVSFYGSAPNEPTGKGGMYIEVLDDSGKVISRFYATSAYNSTNPLVTIYGNKAVMAQGGRSVIEPVLYLPQPLNIKAANGIVTFTYGQYSTADSVFDSSSHWQNPKTLRVYFYCNGSNYGRTIELESLHFSATFKPVASPADTTGIDLMQGLPFKKVLANNVAGWSRMPVIEDSANKYADWWSVSSGCNSTTLLTSPDVYTRFTQNTGNATVKRALEANQGVDNWQLTGVINYLGNAENDPTGKGGMYFELLDDADKIISRFYTVSVWNNVDPVITIYANGAAVAKGVRSIVQPVTFTPQPLEIKAANGAITFTYGTFKALTTTVFDATSNWHNPKTLRLYFYGNGSNYSRIIDLVSMRFAFTGGYAPTTALKATAVTVAASKQTSPALQLKLYPNPAVNQLHADYPQTNKTAILNIVGLDGKSIKQIALPAGSNSTLIDVGLLPHGLYFAKYVNGETFISAKFFK